jgi:hypothetical protein
MHKTLGFLGVFVLAFAFNLLVFLEMWSKAMACADIGHSCRLSMVEHTLLSVFSFPVSFLPDELLPHIFGSNALLPLLLSNATAWGICAVVATRLVLHFARK